jgi:hypothetical protein
MDNSIVKIFSTFAGEDLQSTYRLISNLLTALNQKS